jgi:DNA topoisomerase-1
LKEILPKQNFTSPPPRFNEASLVKTLEGKGIGRPSTYASIISLIQDRGYVEKKEGAFWSTAVGDAVIDFLAKNFDDIIEIPFTAEMEEDLDRIARGEKKWVPVLKTFYAPFEKKVKDVAKNSERVKIQVEKTGKKCPKCNIGEQVVRSGRFGKFLSCSRFPECDWKENYQETIDAKCPECGSPVVMRRTRKGKFFYGCSTWPKCKWASWRKPTPDKTA